MCKCTPNIRTPWCGKLGCEMPEQRQEKIESRFDYIEYNQKSQQLSNERKAVSEQYEALINELPNSREKSLALTKLEECFMWVGKAIRNLQLEEAKDK